MDFNTLNQEGPWTKEKAMVTKLSEKFAIIMLKKHRKFYRRGLTHLDATPIFKNRSDTYETPCIFNLPLVSVFSMFRQNISFETSILGAPVTKQIRTNQ